MGDNDVRRTDEEALRLLLQLQEALKRVAQHEYVLALDAAINSYRLLHDV